MSRPQLWRDQLVVALVVADRVPFFQKPAFRAVPRALFLPGTPAPPSRGSLVRAARRG